MQATFVFIIVIVALAILGFWIWTIVDCIRNPNYDDTHRIGFWSSSC